MFHILCFCPILKFTNRTFQVGSSQKQIFLKVRVCFDISKFDEVWVCFDISKFNKVWVYFSSKFYEVWINTLLAALFVEIWVNIFIEFYKVRIDISSFNELYKVRINFNSVDEIWITMDSFVFVKVRVIDVDASKVIIVLIECRILFGYNLVKVFV